MDPHKLPFSIFLLASAAVLLAVGLWVARWRRTPTALVFLVNMAGTALWLCGYGLFLLGPRASDQFVWSRVQATGSLVAQLGWLLFILYCTQHVQLLRKWWAAPLLVVIPLAILAATWVAPAPWYFDIRGPIDNGLSQIPAAARLGFVVHAGDLFLLLLVGTILLYGTVRRLLAANLVSGLVLLVSILLPWVGGILFLLNVRAGGSPGVQAPGVQDNLMPFAMAGSALLLAWGVFRYRWFGLVPLARKTIVEGLSDGIIVLDYLGRVSDMNPVALRIFGCTWREVSQRPAAELWTRWPELQESGLPPVGAPPAAAVGPLPRQGRWYEMRLKPVGGTFERSVGSLIIVHEITELYEAQRALSASEEYHRSLIEHASDIIMVLNPDSTIRFISPSSAQALGHTPPEMVGTPMASWMHPDDAGRVVDSFVRGLETPGVHQALELRVRHKDGSWRCIEGVANNLLSNPAIAGVVVNARDVTRRKRTLATLERRLALETMAGRVTARLANATSDSLDGEIVPVLQSVAEFMGVERSYVLLLADSLDTVDRVHWWVAPDTMLPAPGRQVVSQFAWLGAQLTQLRVVEVPDVDKLPREARAERDYWQATGTRSALVLPLVAGSRLTGVMSLASKEERPPWVAEDLRLVQSVGEILVNVLTRVRTEQRLRQSEESLRSLNAQLEQMVAQRTASLEQANNQLLSEVTQRISTEKALRRSEAHNQALLAAIPDAILVVLASRVLASRTSSAGVILELRPGSAGLGLFAACSGLNRGSPHPGSGASAQLTLTDCLPPDVAGRVGELVHEALGSSQMQRLEFQVTQDGLLSEYEARAVAMGGDQALVIIRDLSEQRQIQRQLVRAERLAALGELAASLAHDINNPLQIIQSHLDLVLDFPLDAEKKQSYLQVTREQVGRLSRLLIDILALVRPEPQSWAPQSWAPRPVPVVFVSEPADAVDAVNRVLDLVSKRLSEGEIQVVRDLAATARVRMPADQLMQACLNLVLNAIEALHGQPDPKLRVATRESPRESAPDRSGGYDHGGDRDDSVTISVYNNGPAIPDNVLRHLAEPFYTTKPGGNGLGLWSCHNLVQKHGGALGARNVTADRGVVFEITLPVAQ